MWHIFPVSRDERVWRQEQGMATIEVKTEITGNVWKITAEIGQQLKEDETILVLESMKMEIPVAAPEDGRLTEILVAEGDTITEGSVVARIEA
jgi:acetyl-CoA carboxylase biotin carboxyl carrier protein